MSHDMSSFQNFAMKGGSIAPPQMEGGDIMSSVSSVWNGTFDFMNNLVYPYLMPMGLFILLTPGLLISLPPTTSDTCAEIAPLPVEYINSGGGPNYCAGGTLRNPAGDIITVDDAETICKAQERCHRVGISRTVSVWASLVHALVFVVALNLAVYGIRYMYVDDYSW